MVMSLLEEGFKFIHRYSGAVAHSVERPSKFPVWCNSSDVDSMHVRDLSSPSDHAAVLGSRSRAICSIAEHRLGISRREKRFALLY